MTAMKKIPYTKQIVFFTFFLSLNSAGAFAQTGFEEDVDDETTAVPIDNLSYAGLVAGSFLGYTLLKRRKKIS